MVKKILVTGTTSYQNKANIRDFIFELKNKFKGKFRIATLANDIGADFLVKKYALEFDVPFSEFNPYHCHHRLYDVMPEHMFDKKYHSINFHYRDNHAVKWADIIVIFIPEDFKSGLITQFIDKAKKKDKTIKIIKG